MRPCRRTYFDNLRLIADRFHLARTGGSDAHERETLSTVWTEFDEPVETVQDFIDGLKSGRTRPGYDRNVYPTAVGPDL
ncbi:MAG: hypothetical protein M5R36_01620 [Deltaproteobacteria bacterium]|nr:hypothetical protein [Deltaproteobacteria bacterium]